MEREIHIKKVVLDDMEEIINNEMEQVLHHEEHQCECGHHNHKHPEKHHHKHRKPHKSPKPPKIMKIYHDKGVFKTKMFVSKDDLVEYVNDIGDEGYMVDIFKIEDGLYKVVVFNK